MTTDSGEPGFRPFDEFLAVTKISRHRHYRGRPEVRIRNKAAFNELRRHLLSIYAGVNVIHSYVDNHGQTFDCVPIEQQPALRKSGRALARPPELPPLWPDSPSTLIGSRQSTSVQPAHKDRYGNKVACPPGTVPIRRITLDELTRFESLRHYQRKASGWILRRTAVAAPDTPAAASQHEYAFAWQDVANLGGQSILNIWAPPVTGDQVFSLSQQWYVANGTAGAQTVEVGWQVFPQRYGHSDPVLFTYWTADGYQHTGSYSNEAGNFVQYSATCPVGIALDVVSVADATQAEVQVCFILSNGNWWLFVGGTTADHAVGYYPTSLYGGGPLATQAAQIAFGGETLGVTSYPPMGSGAFASKGAGQAAYQRNIGYFPAAGGTLPAAVSPAQQWPQSYTIAVQRSDPWGTFFYFGGPGGTPTPPGT
jgi:hypothetical protein